MTIVACPRCRDEVTVPAGASRKALVRCPLCEEEYLLGDALANVPPALIVVGGDGDSEPEPALAGVGAAAVGENDYRLAGGSFGAMTDASPGSGAVSAPARPALRGKTRPKRKEKSAVVELIKVVMGGVVGLSLGLLAMWWILKRDPLDLGPQVSPYAPWLVPAQFRGKLPAGQTAETATVESGAAARQQGQNTDVAAVTPPPASSTGGFQPHPNLAKAQQKAGGKITTTAPPTGDSLQTLDDPLAGSLTAENPLAPAGLNVPVVDPEPSTPEANPGAEPAAAPAETVTSEPALEPAVAAAPGKAKSKTAPGAGEPTETTSADFRNLLPEGTEPPPADPEGNPTTTESPAAETLPAAQPADLAAAATAASNALTKVDEGKGEPVEVRRQLFTDLYAALAELGRIATHVDLTSADAAEPAAALKGLTDELAAQAGPGTKMSAIGTLARGQLTARKAGEGVAIAGTVTNFQSAGKVFELTVDLGNNATATILCPNNPQDFCQIGDQVLIVGRIVEEPANNLDGYEGEAARVVLLGHAAVVPKM